MKRFVFLLCTMLIAVNFVMGCARQGALSQLEGIVTGVEEGRIQISTREDRETNYIIAIDPKTCFDKEVDQTFYVGSHVVFEVGAIAESYPAQATAQRVIANEKVTDADRR